MTVGGASFVPLADPMARTDPEARDIITQFVNAEGTPKVVLYGKAGVGKTSLMETLHRILEQGGFLDARIAVPTRYVRYR
jgi:putative protein kinase ArgK-like GTPase of G3E family